MDVCDQYRLGTRWPKLFYNIEKVMRESPKLAQTLKLPTLLGQERNLACSSYCKGVQYLAVLSGITSSMA